MSDDSKDKTRTWASVIVVSLSILCVTLLLLLGVPIASIIAGFFSISSLATIYLANKLEKIEQQTNGQIETYRRQLTDLIEFAKSAIPIDKSKEH